MKYLLLSAVLFSISGCGGGSDSDSQSDDGGAENQETADCTVVNNAITLTSGGSCNITEDIAGTFSVTAGDILCDNTVLTYGGSSFSSNGNGLSFNGLTFICQAS